MFQGNWKLGCFGGIEDNMVIGDLGNVQDRDLEVTWRYDFLGWCWCLHDEEYGKKYGNRE